MIQNKTIKYFLYNYDDIENIIKDKEQDIIDSINIGFNNWLKSKHCYTNTLENQAILLAESKELNDLKKIKNNLNNILNYIKNKYPFIYEFINIKYFNKNTRNQIKNKFKIPIEEQDIINKTAISLILEKLESK